MAIPVKYSTLSVDAQFAGVIDLLKENSWLAPGITFNNMYVAINAGSVTMYKYATIGTDKSGRGIYSDASAAASTTAENDIITVELAFPYYSDRFIPRVAENSTAHSVVENVLRKQMQGMILDMQQAAASHLINGGTAITSDDILSDTTILKELTAQVNYGLKDKASLDTCLVNAATKTMVETAIINRQTPLGDNVIVTGQFARYGQLRIIYAEEISKKYAADTLAGHQVTPVDSGVAMVMYDHMALAAPYNLNQTEVGKAPKGMGDVTQVGANRGYKVLEAKAVRVITSKTAK